VTQAKGIGTKQGKAMESNNVRSYGYSQTVDRGSHIMRALSPLFVRRAYLNIKTKRWWLFRPFNWIDP